MPPLAIKSFAEKLGISVEKVEKYWEEAKKELEDEYDKNKESDKFYGTAMKILKNKLKKHEGLTESRFASFLSEDFYPTINEEKFNDYIDLDEKDYALIKLFSNKKKIKDHRDFHALAEKLGMKEAGDLEERAYSMLQSFWSQGRAVEKGMKFDVDENEVKMGIKVEMEHTDSKVMAYRITLDHLAEMKDYYTRLDEMEKSGNVGDL